MDRRGPGRRRFSLLACGFSGATQHLFVATRRQKPIVERVVFLVLALTTQNIAAMKIVR
jgi:hypothetical protein